MKNIFQKCKLLKVLGYFLDNPHVEIYPSKLSKSIGIPVPTLIRYLRELEKLGYLDRRTLGRVSLYKLKEGPSVRQAKIFRNVEFLVKSGVVDYIVSNTSGLSAIVLYGSWAKGTNTQKSDVDLLVICDSSEIDEKDLEKIIKRQVDIKVMRLAQWVSQKDKNRGFYFEVLVHGIPLYGELPVIV